MHLTCMHSILCVMTSEDDSKLILMDCCVEKRLKVCINAQQNQFCCSWAELL